MRWRFPFVTVPGKVRRGYGMIDKRFAANLRAQNWSAFLIELSPRSRIELHSGGRAGHYQPMSGHFPDPSKTPR